MDAWQKQKTDEAQAKLDRALKIYPGFPDALVFSGFMQGSQGNWHQAEEHIQAAIQSDPNYCPAYIILAGIYNTEGRYDEAQEAAQQPVCAGANSWTLQYEIARVLIGKGEYEHALAITDASLRGNHGSLMHVARAHALLGLRRYLEATTELRNYLHYQPSGEGSQDARDILERLGQFGSR